MAVQDELSQLQKNLTGLPCSIKRFYGRFYKTVYLLDSIFNKVPVLNLLSGVIEGIARKKCKITVKN